VGLGLAELVEAAKEGAPCQHQQWPVVAQVLPELVLVPPLLLAEAGIDDGDGAWLGAAASAAPVNPSSWLARGARLSDSWNAGHLKLLVAV
jgi:hypothetical protein